MDVDLYQSQKALDNGKLALEDDGIIILISKCRTGIGEDSFLNLLGGAASCNEVMEKLDDEYKLGYHKAAKMAQIGTRAEMWAVTDLDEETIKKAQQKIVYGLVGFLIIFVSFWLIKIIEAVLGVSIFPAQPSTSPPPSPPTGPAHEEF